MEFCCRTILLLVFLLPTVTEGQLKVSDLHRYACAASSLTLSCDVNSNFPDQIMSIKSITVYATSDYEVAIAKQCSYRQAQCQRIVRTQQDAGVSGDYEFFYKFIYSKCENKMNCTLKMPDWFELVGVNNDNNAENNCPISETLTKYFVGILIHSECITGLVPVTATPPPSTTPRTEPTTAGSTTPFPVLVPIFLAQFTAREKIILGICIGVAVILLIILLIMLVCWDRWRRDRKLAKLLRLLGRPQEQPGFDDYEDYAKADAWKDETENPDALGEYTGMKPNDFVTLDRKTMERDGMIVNDSMLSTLPRGNMCATLSKGVDRGQPAINEGYNYDGPVDYETEENLELERRMAAAVAEDEPEVVSDEEAVTQH